MERVANDILRCPICLNLPESYVYQCRNGHVICRQCSEKLRYCPQCRSKYDTLKRRCRVLEDILENMEVDCPYKVEGCVKAMLRKELSQHRESCEFKPIKFCQLVGYTDCTFSSHDDCKIVNHLREIHSVPFLDLGTISLPRKSRSSAIVPLGFMKPTIVAATPTHNFLLYQTLGQYQTVSVIAIHFGREDNCLWDVQYNIQDKKSRSMIQWKMPPVSFINKNVSNYLATPPFQIPKLYLEEIQPRKNCSVLADVIVSIDSSKFDQTATIHEHNQSKSNNSTLKPKSKITEPTSNDEMVEKLKLDGIIKSDNVMKIMRAVDRGHFVSDKNNAYKDATWKEGSIHLSSPAIYATVLEALELRPGLHFLNIGSGSGYLSTMVGMALGGNCFNCGIDCNSEAVRFAKDKVKEFEEIYNSPNLFPPITLNANIYEEHYIMKRVYDRVYCGAQCPKEDVGKLHKLLEEGGICIAPVDGKLLKIRRTSENDFESTVLMSATFEPLINPCE